MRSTFSPPLLVGRRRRRIVFFSVTGPGENFPDAEQVSHLTSVRVERDYFVATGGKRFSQEPVQQMGGSGRS
jgi:hypothetical protein